MPNHLTDQTSPYLLQHAENPVDWYPWSEEALNLAVDQNKPIFLSIGYAACHWCHVMAHESFEDPAVAEILNRFFISIKVDREERPDLDNIYMNAVVAMTGNGGWPLSLFLTPAGKPFYGGTYFPPQSRYGLPSFSQVLNSIIQAWRERPSDIQNISDSLTNRLRIETGISIKAGDTSGNLSVEDGLRQAVNGLINSYDEKEGGWGAAPKFPQPMAIDFLLYQSSNISNRSFEVALQTLSSMSRGGMYDLVGGGFHRYSTDSRWLVPHFEKMLYDNAQLARSYLHAYLLSRNEDFLEVCERTLNFLLRELSHASGGFFSSLDADSEGVEGKYYTWSFEELAQCSPSDMKFMETFLGIHRRGHYEGKNIIRLQDEIFQSSNPLSGIKQSLKGQLNEILNQLFTRRQSRQEPAVDDKIIVSWNGLALIAFSEAARYLNNPTYLLAAQNCAKFILKNLTVGKILYRTWRNGIAHTPAFLEDYSAMILGLLSLYQTDLDETWYIRAIELASEMVDQFYEPGEGFFDTRRDQSQLILRPRDIQDNATPSGSAMATLALLVLDAYSPNSTWHSIAEEIIQTMVTPSSSHPLAFSFWLQALHFYSGPIEQIGLVGDPTNSQTQAMLAIIRSHFNPLSVIGFHPDSQKISEIQFLNQKGSLLSSPTAYLCQNFICTLPTTSPELLREKLQLTTFPKNSTFLG